MFRDLAPASVAQGRVEAVDGRRTLRDLFRRHGLILHAQRITERLGFCQGGDPRQAMVEAGLDIVRDPLGRV